MKNKIRKEVKRVTVLNCRKVDDGEKVTFWGECESEYGMRIKYVRFRRVHATGDEIAIVRVDYTTFHETTWKH